MVMMTLDDGSDDYYDEWVDMVLITFTILDKFFSEELIQETFAQFGDVQEVRVFKEKGFAFIRSVLHFTARQ